MSLSLNHVNVEILLLVIRLLLTLVIIIRDFIKITTARDLAQNSIFDFIMAINKDSLYSTNIDFVKYMQESLRQEGH